MSTSKQALSNSKKAIIAVVVMTLVVTATMLIFKNRPEAQKDTKFSFTTSPRVVNVSVNGTDYGSVETGTELTLPATSTANVEVTQKGFEPYTGTVEVNPGNTNAVHVALISETDEAWALIDEEKELKQEQEVTEKYLDNTDEAFKKFPILKQLPYEANKFSVYQGLPKSAGYEFGLHLYLYKGHEDEGRKAFTNWMTAQKLNTADYDVVENIQDKSLPIAFPEPQTMKQLEALTPNGITIPTNLTNKGLDADQLAQLFAVSTTTWDTKKDNHHSAALTRATKLMTKIEAGLTQIPEKPITTPTWRSAAQTEARSKSWITEYESTKQKDGSTTATVKVCWAWIAEDQEPKIDGPRTYQLTITNGDPAIAKYTYKDPDPFVDNSQTPCIPTDA